jgi:hypothetical protein
MKNFDPTRFNFVLLEDFRIPGDVPVYEFKNHSTVNGKKDFLRLNLYLSVDREYVTIWFGLLEPMFAEIELASAAKHEDFDFSSYNEDLFKGYVDSDEAAGYIFKALRVAESHRYAQPQVLSKGANNELRCDLMQA